MLGDLLVGLDHSLTIAWGLLFSVTYESDPYTTKGWFLTFDHATWLILHLPASSGTTLVQCIWWCISVSEFPRGLFFLDPGTMCLRHLLPGSRTKWAHFTLRWICLFFWKTILFWKLKWAHFTRKEIFFLKSTMNYSNNLLLRWCH